MFEMVWACENIDRSLLRVELPGRRPNGRPKTRYKEVVRRHNVVGVKEEDRQSWRKRIFCSNP